MLKKLLLSSAFFFSASQLFAQTSRVQFINNCPDVSLNGVDVYVDGLVQFDNILFRWNSDFTFLNTGAPIKIGIADYNASAITDTFYSTTLTLVPGTDYIIVLNGVKPNATGYNPKKSMSLSVFAGGKDNANFPPGTDLLFMHGSPDAAAPIDIKSGMTTYGSNVNYGQFAKDYAVFPQADRVVRFTDPATSAILKKYGFPLTAMNYAGKAAVVVSSGFVKPGQNNNGPAYGLWMTIPGQGAMIPVADTPNAEAIAKIQLINNAADTATDSVDIYFNDALTVHNLPFRHATSMQELLVGTPVTISIAPKNSTSSADSFYSMTMNYDSAVAYIAVANGLVSTSGYKPLRKFQLNTYKGAMQVGIPLQTNILTINGATDVEGLGLNITDGSNLYGSNLTFSNFNNTYTPIVKDTILKVTDAASSKKVQDYDANWSAWGLTGQAVTLLTSGFLKPADNKNGPSFGLYYAKMTGGPLDSLPIHKPISVEKIQASQRNISIWPNPANSILNLDGKISFATATAAIYDITGRLVQTVAHLGNKQIDISALTKGIYTIQLFADNEAISIRFVKD